MKSSSENSEPFEFDNDDEVARIPFQSPGAHRPPPLKYENGPSCKPKEVVDGVVKSICSIPPTLTIVVGPPDAGKTQFLVRQCSEFATGKKVEEKDSKKVWQYFPSSVFSPVTSRLVPVSKEIPFYQTENYIDFETDERPDSVTLLHVNVVSWWLVKKFKEVNGVSSNKQFETDVLNFAAQRIDDTFEVYKLVDDRKVYLHEFGAATQALYTLTCYGEYMSHHENSAVRMLCVDEPEVFCSSAQSRRICRFLFDKAKSNGWQLVFATHSSNVLRELVPEKPLILRLEKQVVTHSVDLSAHESLYKEFANHTVLGSQCLEGLFHKHVFVVEGVSDVTFWSAIANKFLWDDSIFVIGCGGHSFVEKLVRPLRRLGCQVCIVADIDCIFEGLRKTWLETGPSRNDTYVRLEKLKAHILRDDDEGDGESSLRGKIKAEGVDALRGPALAQLRRDLTELLFGLASHGVKLYPGGQLESVLVLPVAKKNMVGDS